MANTVSTKCVARAEEAFSVIPGHQRELAGASELGWPRVCPPHMPCDEKEGCRHTEISQNRGTDFRGRKGAIVEAECHNPVAVVAFFQ